MTNLCGHDRDALSFALGLVHMSSLYAQNDPEVLAYRATRDPAKLAEMLAARGRELGLAFWHGPNEPREPSPTDYVLYVIDGIIRLYSPLSPKAWQRHYAIAQARAILLQWLQLPDGAREKALQVLRGNHVDPDELINTIPMHERIAPRRFDPDPDRGE